MIKNKVTKTKRDMLIFIFTFVLFVSLLFTSVKSGEAQSQIDFDEKLSWFHRVGPASLIILFAIGGASILIGIVATRGDPRLRKYLVLGGLVFIFGGLAIAEIVYLIPLITTGPAITYTNCRQVSIEMDNITNVPYTVGCILTGYVPEGDDMWTLISFIIFGVILPATFFIYLFYDAIDFVGNKSVRNVLSFVAGLMAFRGAAETLFVEFLTYGMLGMGLLLVNFFILMIIYGRIKKGWQATEAISGVLKMEKWELYRSYKEQLDKNIQERERLTKIVSDPNIPEDQRKKAEESLKKLEEIGKRLEKELEELAKRLS